VASRERAVFWMLVHAASASPKIPVAATAWLWKAAASLRWHYTGQRALSVFKVSNVYLSLILLAIVVASLV